MQVAIMADLHNNLDSWKKIKEILNWQNITCLLNCGDITNIGTLDTIAKEFNGQIHTVFGNMDQDVELMKVLGGRYPFLHIHGYHGNIVINNKRFLLSHYQDELETYVEKVPANILCCGHTHAKLDKQTEKYRVINPGTAGGIFASASFAIYDININKLKFIDI